MNYYIHTINFISYNFSEHLNLANGSQEVLVKFGVQHHRCTYPFFFTNLITSVLLA